TIDATEWIGPYNDLALGLHKAAKYYYTPGWQEPNVTFELDINLKAWETLPPDLQAIVRAAARDVNGDMLDDYNAKNMEALEQMREQGVEIRELPEPVLQRLKEVAAQAVEDAAAADPVAARVWAQQKAYLQRLYAYAELNEKKVYNMGGYVRAQPESPAGRLAFMFSAISRQTLYILGRSPGQPMGPGHARMGELPARDVQSGAQVRVGPQGLPAAVLGQG